MATFLYKPDHPMANPEGFVTKEDYLEYNYYKYESKQMMDGNRPVCFYYIADEMPPVRHMARPNDGRMYTSKKKFRDETRARGCIEVGNETQTLMKPRKRIELSKKERVEAIKHAIEVEKGKMTKKQLRKKR